MTDNVIHPKFRKEKTSDPVETFFHHLNELANTQQRTERRRDRQICTALVLSGLALIAAAAAVVRK